MSSNEVRRQDWRPKTSEPIFEVYDRLRSESPVAHSDDYGGFWTLTRYAHVSKAARDWKTFSSAAGSPFIEIPDFRAIPLNFDPPEHGRVRGILNRYVKPERIAALRPRLEGFVTEHVDELLDGGRGNAYVLASTLPQRALALLLNMPDDTYLLFMAKLHQLHEAAVAKDVERANALMKTLWTDEVVELVEARRAQPQDPETDLMSGVLAAEIDGQPISPEVCVAIGIQLMSAGGDTTTSAITNSLWFLARDRELQDRLRRDPALVPAAVEEFLRLRPPLHHLARTATTDTEVDGRTIPAGSRVSLNYAAANRDADAFPQPDTIDLDRSPNRHLTFGFGPHLCLGAPLARLELHLVLTQLLARTSGFELDGDAVEQPKTSLGSGFSSLPLRFTS
jgi:cytochrome P450